jgi:hypothetical protein
MYKYSCEFTVTGHGSLPLDMLRYDRATPLTQEDVKENSYVLDTPAQIRLIRFTQGKGNNYGDMPTVDRWKSFGWTVSDIVWRKL